MTGLAGLTGEKIRAREQWGQDPCGAEYDREHELGTREFFDTIEAASLHGVCAVDARAYGL